MKIFLKKNESKGFLLVLSDCLTKQGITIKLSKALTATFTELIETYRIPKFRVVAKIRYVSKYGYKIAPELNDRTFDYYHLSAEKKVNYMPKQLDIMGIAKQLELKF